MSYANTTLVLAAHGAGDGSEANQRVLGLAERLQERSPFAKVRTAFRLGTPSFTSALQGLEKEKAVIVPLLTSRGYFYDRVLTQEVTRSQLPDNGPRFLTAPLGEHPGLVRIAKKHLEEAWIEADFEENLEAGSTVIVVGHGTRRHPRSGDTTRSLAESLAGAFADSTSKLSFEVAFLDAPPYLEEVITRHQGRPIVAIPFLLGGGDHAKADIPQCMKRVLGSNRTSSNGTPWAIAAPLGEGQALEELVLNLALSSPQPSAATANLPASATSSRYESGEKGELALQAVRDSGSERAVTYA